MRDTPKVFLSYAAADRHFADRLFDYFQRSQTSVFIDRVDPLNGEHILGVMRSQIAASDFLVLLLSPEALESALVRRELEYAVSTELRQRSITVVPMKVKSCRLPDFLESWTVIDASRDFNRGAERLSKLLRAAPQVRLERLNPEQFEALVGDVLKAYGFKQVLSARHSFDAGFDFSAQSVQRDPFGRPELVDWIVEVKAAKQQTDTSTLRAFLGALSLRSERGLFVTSSQLTSPAKDWLDHVRRPNGPRLTLLEGTDVRRLVMAKPRLVEKYFSVEE